MDVSPAGYPLVAIRPALETPWDYEVNPDGTKTLLLRDDLGLTQTLAMINDLLHDRLNGCQIWAEHVLKMLGTDPAQITAHMVYELAQHNIDWTKVGSSVGDSYVPESRQPEDYQSC